VTTLVKAAALLVCSNLFMTFAWYAHLRNLRSRVPANRIGFGVLHLAQLKILIYMREPVGLEFLWAGFCLLGGVYFMFRA
jgi:uncharacterized protein (DUF486 family)